MAYYVITETGVYQYRNIPKMKREISAEKEDFTKVGSDYVLNMTDESFEIAKDIRLLEIVASKNVFKKDSLDVTNMLQVFTMILIYFMTR